MADFAGFPDDLFGFLNDLKKNNNREWFKANKPRYTESVVNPMCEFIACMAPRLQRISKHYTADPRPHGGSMFRIYRDVRFSKDKSPYKTHAACQFRHQAGRDAHAPGFYVHLAADGLFFGGGIWTPPSAHLGKIREQIADSPVAWSRIIGAAAVRKHGGLKGDQLKRAPRGFDPESRHIEDLKRKAAAPLNRFITQALELPF
jgi:uncharacterized protein (TIGR02453 family)